MAQGNYLNKIVPKKQLTLYSEPPVSVSWITWRVALTPSVTLERILSGIGKCWKQNVPFPVWLKGVTSGTFSRVTLLPIPRFTYVCAHGWDPLKTTEPPSTGQRVRLLAEMDWLTPPQG